MNNILSRNNLASVAVVIVIVVLVYSLLPTIVKQEDMDKIKDRAEHNVVNEKAQLATLPASTSSAPVTKPDDNCANGACSEDNTSQENKPQLQPETTTADAQGRPISKTINGVTTYIVYDKDGNPHNVPQE